jgi:hypothetical protein
VSKVKGLTVSRETHSYEKEDGEHFSKSENYYIVVEFDGLWAFLESRFATPGDYTITFSFYQFQPTHFPQ